MVDLFLDCCHVFSRITLLTSLIYLTPVNILKDLHPGSNVKICVSLLLLLLLLLPLLLGLSLHLTSSTEEPYVILLEAKGEGKVEFTLFVYRMFSNFLHISMYLADIVYLESGSV